ncbi:AbrB/MazE/SpoVT family DNA-binding domain-containing protein [archaeon]|nr:AbrB/MazE/SpoVT family DNA-binding domain-containing protein [archaeon]
MINESLIGGNMLVTISKGQQITIPAEMRKELNLHVGSKVELTKKGRKLIIEPLEEDLEQIFLETKNLKPKMNLTAEQMDELNERLFR